MKILNIAGYKFISLKALPALCEVFLQEAEAQTLKGTILLSLEGININLAGMAENIANFINFLKKDVRFNDITFRETESNSQPFNQLKVKIKKEIISLRQPEIQPEKQTAPHISPQEFKQWLDEKRSITVLDTRNEHEIHFGTFRNSLHLGLKDFSQFPTKTNEIPRNKPVVMFCTGGIRCEKAASVLLNSGFPKVFQLEGGILNYFSQVGGEYYEGDCFVFDERIALNPNLKAIETSQCRVCSIALKKVELLPAQSCQTCIQYLT